MFNCVSIHPYIGWLEWLEWVKRENRLNTRFFLVYHSDWAVGNGRYHSSLFILDKRLCDGRNALLISRLFDSLYFPTSKFNFTLSLLTSPLCRYSPVCLWHPKPQPSSHYQLTPLPTFACACMFLLCRTDTSYWQTWPKHDLFLFFIFLFAVFYFENKQNVIVFLGGTSFSVDIDWFVACEQNRADGEIIHVEGGVRRFVSDVNDTIREHDSVFCCDFAVTIL